MSKTAKIIIGIIVILVVGVLLYFKLIVIPIARKQHCNTYCCRVESCDCSDEAKQGDLCKCQYLAETDDGETYKEIYCPEEFNK